MGRPAVQRAIVVVVAIVVVGWLGTNYRNSGKIDDAAFLAARPSSTPAQIEKAVEDVRSAGTLNPSKTDTLAVEAALELRRSHLVAAAKVLEEIVRREPDSREAWFLLAQVDRVRDPGRAAQARAQLKRLDPFEARREHL
jgi:Tfp pilus assembly protein PilF